jgi:hypothetical protein
MRSALQQGAYLALNLSSKPLFNLGVLLLALNLSSEPLFNFGISLFGLLVRLAQLLSQLFHLSEQLFKQLHTHRGRSFAQKRVLMLQLTTGCSHSVVTKVHN